MNIHLYDAHAHLADQRLAREIRTILDDSVRRGVRGIAAAAARRVDWDFILELARKCSAVLAVVGVHPFFPEDWTPETGEELRRAAAAPRVRAIGEIGLDFQHGRANARLQEEMFAAQIEIACELRKPVVLHNRKSWEEFFHIWKETGQGRIAGVCHHFTGSREILRRVLDAGLYVSFCGPLTYPNARRIREAAAYAPDDRILTETDCPDLPPAPVREAGGEQSRPWHVREVLKTLSEVRGAGIAEVAELVETNFTAVFGPLSDAGESTRSGAGLRQRESPPA